jgi:hypothetical protein
VGCTPLKNWLGCIAIDIRMAKLLFTAMDRTPREIHEVDKYWVMMRLVTDITSMEPISLIVVAICSARHSEQTLML